MPLIHFLAQRANSPIKTARKLQVQSWELENNLHTIYATIFSIGYSVKFERQNLFIYLFLLFI